MVTARTSTTVRLAFVVSAVLVAAVLGAQPAAAYRELGSTGTVGHHSLDDTRSSPGAYCLYDYHNMGSAQVLERIRVQPPNVRAAARQADQLVGWSFSVDRRSANAFTADRGPWERTFNSQVATATTNWQHDADFSATSVRVFVPGDPSADAWYLYRVTVRAYWYGANHSVAGTAAMRVEWFHSRFGADSEQQRWKCRSAIL